MPHQRNQSYGIDTSIFVRLLTGHPESDYNTTVKALQKLQAASAATEFFVSNQVIGEAYITLQHHYQISKKDARSAIAKVLGSGSIQPMNEQPVLDLLARQTSAGLVDALITQEYNQNDMEVLTNDQKMSKLTGAKKL